MRNFIYDEIILFVQIVQLGSLSTASQRLRMSETSLRGQIRILEEKLKMSLLTILDNGQIKLTEQGMLLFNNFEDHSTVLKELVEPIYSSKHSEKGTLKISVAFVFADTVLIPNLTRFSYEHPDINLDIHCHYIEIDAIKDDYDLAIIGFSPNQLTQKIRRIYQFKGIICCTPKYVEKHGLLTSIDDLTHHQIINHIFQDNMTLTSVSLYSESDDSIVKTCSIPTNLAINDAGLAKQMILHGEVIGACAQERVHKDLQEGRLIRLLPEYYIGYGSIYLLRNIDQDDIRYQKFNKFLQNCLSSNINPA